MIFGISLVLILFTKSMALGEESVTLFKESFTRGKGKKQVEFRAFPAIEGPAVLKVKKEKGCNVSIEINGEKIKFGHLKKWEKKDKFKEEEKSEKFKIRGKNKYHFIEKEIYLFEGDNFIEVTLKGRPESKVLIEIIQELPFEEAQVIGPEGGLIEETNIDSPLLGVKVDIPPNALESKQIISISIPETPYNLPEDMELAGKRIELGPTGISFSNPILITLSYNDFDNDGIVDDLGVPEESVEPVTFDSDGNIEFLNVVSRDFEKNQVTFSTSHLSEFLLTAMCKNYYLLWNMDTDSESDWEEASQYTVPNPDDGTYESKNITTGNFKFGYSLNNNKVLDIWTDPGIVKENKWQRVKVRTKDQYGYGSYTWRVKLPDFEENTHVGVGAFLYNDDEHELDFEIGYGGKNYYKFRTTRQGFPQYTNINYIRKTENNWYSLRMVLNKIKKDGLFNSKVVSKVEWYVDDGSGFRKIDEVILNYVDWKFYIFCSVENLSLYGKYDTTYETHAYFDYVRYIPFEERNGLTWDPMLKPGTKNVFDGYCPGSGSYVYEQTYGGREFINDEEFGYIETIKINGINVTWNETSTMWLQEINGKLIQLQDIEPYSNLDRTNIIYLDFPIYQGKSWNATPEVIATVESVNETLNLPIGRLTGVVKVHYSFSDGRYVDLYFHPDYPLNVKWFDGDDGCYEELREIR
ncbi:MAG: hypothetical protein D6813_08950 [Calditrichaeota bacterium]|nr:MAG: hypothetical protein D6813_08950 [Calditrichota bacterium]